MNCEDLVTLLALAVEVHLIGSYELLDNLARTTCTSSDELQQHASSLWTVEVAALVD